MAHYTRDQAGLRPPSQPFDEMKTPVSTVVIHHAAIPSTADSVHDAKLIDESERSRGFIAGAYHIFIHPNGDSFEFRIVNGDIKLGAATKGNNSNTLAICFGGNMMFDTPTAAALEKAAQIISGWVNRGEVTKGFVARPHSDFVATACPGLNLKPFVGSIASRANAILGTNTTPVPAPAPVVPKPISKPFPLPAGHWYGVKSADNRNHSGFWVADRPGVSLIQQRLGIPADGIFGPQTARYVRAFQANNGLVVDERFGAKSWAKMFS